MASNPFKVGDRVYVYMHGWGKVTNDADIVTVELDGVGPALVFVKEDYRLVSFTEYDPIKGGLSHERPEEKKRPTVDTSKFYDPDDFNLNYCINREGSHKAGMIHPLTDKEKEEVRALSNQFANYLDRNIGCYHPPHGNYGRDEVIPAETAERNLKALKYIKKLLKDNYNVVDDFISVEELGDEVQVSLTFKKV